MEFLQIQNLNKKLAETEYFRVILTMYDKKELSNGANYYERYSTSEKNTLRTIEPMGLKDKTNNPVLKYKDKSIFSIRRFEEQENDRYHVIIYNFKIGDELDYERIVLYTSKSEGLFWRFCGKRYDGKYDKGFNYVTTTFVNMDLQLFLFHSMQYFNIEKKEVKPSDCEPFDKLSYKPLIDRLTSNYKSMDKDPVFTLLDNIFPYDTMRSRQFYNNQIEFLKILLKLTMRNFINGHEKNVTNKLIERLGVNDCLKFRDSESRREFYKRWYTSLTEFFLYFFKLDTFTAETLIPNRTIHFDDRLQPVIVNMSVNRILAENKHSKKTYIIYYIKYKTSLEQDSKKTYKHILNIALSDTNLTKHGIDNNYVSCGMFVSKIFDYYKQITITRTDNERDYMDYTFVGDVFHVPQLP